MNDTPRATGNQAGTFTCPGCNQRCTFTQFGAGVFNELMEPGESAPVCGTCTWRAVESTSYRERIERTVRHQKPGTGADRIVVVNPSFFEMPGDL